MPSQAMIADPGLPQTLLSRRNLPGCHGISSAKMALAVPTEVAALHYLVTAFSIKKALTVCCGLYAPPSARGALMLPAHTPLKCAGAGDFPDCHNQFVKE
jgi:hypothetical protein